MVRKLGCLALALVVVGSFAACGSGGDPDDDNLKYAGDFAVVEEYLMDNPSTSCSAKPAQFLDNQVTVAVKGAKYNEIEFIFELRWGTLKDGLDASAGFTVVHTLGAGQSFNLSGSFSSADAFSGTLKDISQGCTRMYTVTGQRALP
jgi:hypothetical protein